MCGICYLIAKAQKGDKARKHFPASVVALADRLERPETMIVEYQGLRRSVSSADNSGDFESGTTIEGQAACITGMFYATELVGFLARIVGVEFEDIPKELLLTAAMMFKTAYADGYKAQTALLKYESPVPDVFQSEFESEELKLEQPTPDAKELEDATEAIVGALSEVSDILESVANFRTNPPSARLMAECLAAFANKLEVSGALEFVDALVKVLPLQEDIILYYIYEAYKSKVR